MNFIYQLLNGIQIGSIYGLIALGYTMVYGIAKLINFAHGDILMIGAYTALSVLPLLNARGLPVWASGLVAMVVCGLAGVLIEKIAYRPLRNSPRIANLITAIGVSLLIENLVAKFIGTGAKPFPRVFEGEAVHVGDLKLSLPMLITVIVTLILTLLLQLFLRGSKWGTAMLATSEDYGAASMIGINVDHAISLTFAIGSALAALGAIFYLAVFPQINPTMGMMLGIKAFIAAVVGGIGNVPGAVVGGLILGIIEALSKAYVSTALSDAFVFAVLIIVLLVKPSGLFGKEMREKV
ncbi:MAG: branched-chain amino acid ABC transporter permease [Clostridiales bacterium]|nr:branched-chain amino acid ABC transporter permease [Clostridiales bacterium]MDD7433075.1 branched-chain amino acid ABC transporter permease [Clostridiales bacterium]MDY3061790.1 branched-chain amino acid ABC transporter permease [Eubacteriales bacterium]